MVDRLIADMIQHTFDAAVNDFGKNFAIFRKMIIFATKQQYGKIQISGGN